MFVRRRTSTTGSPLNVPDQWLDHDHNAKRIRKLRWIGRPEEAELLAQELGRNIDVTRFPLHDLAERLQAIGAYLSVARHGTDSPGPATKVDAIEKASREFRRAHEAFHRLREHLAKNQVPESRYSQSKHWLAAERGLATPVLVVSKATLSEGQETPLNRPDRAQR